MPTSAIIIGAAKAGTTSLFNVLGHHAEVCPASLKETRFFSDDARFARGLDWYAREYFGHATREPVWLEASPAYLTWSEKVAPRLRMFGPAAPKLIAILRDPVRRAYSHYWHRVRLGHEPLSFAEAIAQEDERLRANWDDLSRAGDGRYGYVRAGCYATRLRPFLEQFDRQQFCFLLQEDLAPDVFPQTISQLLSFLGVESTALPPVHVNMPTRARHPALTSIYWRLKRTALQPIYVRFVPRPVRAALLGALFPATTYPPMPAEVEQALRQRFADEVRACAAMINRDLSHWLPV